MYCRKCGKPVEDGDAFCTYCGTPVSVNKPAEHVERTPEDPVRRTAAAYNPEFKWNNAGFHYPARKTEDINFDWERGTNTPRRDTREAEPAMQVPNREAEYEAFHDRETAEIPEHFRQEEKFQTFAMKNEEFQKLLDREYERIRRNGNPVERPETMGSLFDTEPVSIPAAPTEEAKPFAEEKPVNAPEASSAKEVSKAAENEKTQEIRTIWEEIKADLEREALENQEKRAIEPDEIRKNTQVLQAAAIAEAAKEWAEVKPQETEKPETETPEAPKPETEETEEPETKKPESENAEPSGEHIPDDDELAAAEALKKMWANMAQEEEKKPKKANGWVVLFVILVVLGLLIAVGIGLQKWAPDTQIAEWCKTAEDWAVESWETLIDACKSVINK